MSVTPSNPAGKLAPKSPKPLRAIAAAAAALAACMATNPACAQAWPAQPIRMVVPFAAGGGTDTLARALGEKMSAAFGQPVLVDNKAGASGNIGTEFVAKAPADGYTTVLGITTSLLTNAFLYKKLPFDPQKDLVLISQVAMGPLVLLVHPAVPVKTAPELLEYVAANKGKLSYGSYGVGSYPHLAGAHMSLTQDAGMIHVAYKGEAPMMQDLIGGQIPMAYATSSQAKQHIETGRVRALGVTGSERMSSLPDVPTLVEQGLTDGVYSLTGWFALAAPAKTPKPVLQRIGTELRAACLNQALKDRILAMGFVPVCSTPEEAAAMYQRERPIYQQLVQQTGVTLD